MAERNYIPIIVAFLGGMLTYYIINKTVISGALTKAKQTVQAALPTPMLLTQPKPQLISPDLGALPQSPKGEVFTRSINVDTSVYLLDDRHLGGLNWTSFDLTNNGPDGLYFSVNNMDMPESALPAGETIHIDFKQRQSIKKIYLQSTGSSEALFFVVR